MLSIFWLLSLLTGFVLANVEKTIFIAPFPDPVSVPVLERLNWKTLTPSMPSTRLHLDAAFPTSSEPDGLSSWFYLEGLTPGQRYEVRVCWLATQSTSFTLTTYTPLEVSNSPTLLDSATTYADEQQHIKTNDETEMSDSTKTTVTGSSALLRIQAAADYYTLNKTTMAIVPPIHADLILDPYLLNILPRSLVPTIPYVIVAAIVAWYVSQFVYSKLVEVASHGQRSRAMVSEKEKRGDNLKLAGEATGKKRPNRIDFFHVP